MPSHIFLSLRSLSRADQQQRLACMDPTLIVGSAKASSESAQLAVRAFDSKRLRYLQNQVPDPVYFVHVMRDCNAIIVGTACLRLLAV